MEPVEQSAQPEKLPLNDRNTAGTDQDRGEARVLLMKLRQQSSISRAQYTAMFYLEELGRLRAFDGRTTDMNKLSGKNFETTRRRILELKQEHAVCKDPKSDRLQKISLTPLGKLAYFLHTGETEEPSANSPTLQSH